jgi:hypothetical protein
MDKVLKGKFLLSEKPCILVPVINFGQAVASKTEKFCRLQTEIWCANAPAYQTPTWIVQRCNS